MSGGKNYPNCRGRGAFDMTILILVNGMSGRAFRPPINPNRKCCAQVAWRSLVQSSLSLQKIVCVEGHFFSSIALKPTAGSSSGSSSSASVLPLAFLVKTLCKTLLARRFRYVCSLPVFPRKEENKVSVFFIFYYSMLEGREAEGRFSGEKHQNKMS